MDKITMEYRPPFRVELEYYKDSGKYYSSGDYLTQKLQMYEIFDEVRQMLASGKRPGLVDGHNEFYTIVRVPNHPHDHPALIVPTKDTFVCPVCDESDTFCIGDDIWRCRRCYAHTDRAQFSKNKY